MSRNFGPNNTIDLSTICQTANVKPKNDLFVNTSVLSNANGSAYVEYGDSKVICSVFSPMELRSKEQISVTVRYAPFSQKSRIGFVNDDDIRYSKFVESSLSSAIDYSQLLQSKLDIHIIVLNDDGNAASAMITCASLALRDANVKMYDMLTGINLAPFCTTSDDSQPNKAVSVAVMPTMRQIANFQCNIPMSVEQYQTLMKWDGPLKEAIHMNEIVKIHLKSKFVQ